MSNLGGVGAVDNAIEPGSVRLMEAAALDALFASLHEAGYRVIGPTVRDGAIVLDELAAAGDLPFGWGVRLEPGGYRIRRRAIQIQDQVLGGGQGNSRYAARRAAVLIVAVNCTEPGETCFCTSMGTGPEAGPGYDLALTELASGERHAFLVDVGTEAGASVLAGMPLTHAGAAVTDRARSAVAEASQRMGRSMPAAGLRELLADSHDAARWDDVASRCLTCGNCTLACPTCFCTSVEDVTDLSGDHAERWQHWASCFDLDFSYLHGGPVRASASSRYRQWLTHKLGTWHDQFGSSGCVGCGRCIVWCPVGIDITEEVAALQAEAQGKKTQDVETRDGAQ